MTDISDNDKVGKDNSGSQTVNTPKLTDDFDFSVFDKISDDAPGSIVPRMFNQLNVILIDISEVMLQRADNPMTPFDSVYYALSDYFESLYSFRHKKNFSISIITFARDPDIVLGVTNLEEKEGNIPLDFLPQSAKVIEETDPDKIKESNIIPALKIASDIAIKFNENPPVLGLPNYISLILISDVSKLDPDEIEVLIQQMLTYKNFEVFLGLFGNSTTEALSKLKSILSSEGNISQLSDNDSVFSFLKRASTDNFRFKI
jgi:hypothetical protein